MLWYLADNNNGTGFNQILEGFLKVTGNVPGGFQLPNTAVSRIHTDFTAFADTQQEIRALTNELEEKQSYTSQKVFEMEQKIDLAEVERKATELGMQRPDKHQIIYVDVKTEDVTEVTAGDVEGIKNRSANFFDRVKKNIMGVFSIQ